MKLIPFNPSISDPDFSEKTFKISEYLKTQPHIERAWIFGSFARGDQQALSDIDVVVEADSTLPLMTLFGIQEQLSTLRFIAVGLTPRLKPRVIKFQHTRP